MILRIQEAIGRIAQDLAKYLEPAAIVKLCRAARYHWRLRVLDSVSTIHLFVLQILNGNTACSHLPHLAKKPFTASAYCQARARLQLKIFQKLLNSVGQALEAVTDQAERWRGHRVFLLDGSGFSMPDTPGLQKKFGQPGAQKPGCGFPVAHLLLLFHAGTGLLRQVLAAPLRTHDMSQVAALHPELGEGDVLAGRPSPKRHAVLEVIDARDGVDGLEAEEHALDSQHVLADGAVAAGLAGLALEALLLRAEPLLGLVVLHGAAQHLHPRPHAQIRQVLAGERHFHERRGGRILHRLRGHRPQAAPALGVQHQGGASLEARGQLPERRAADGERGRVPGANARDL